MPLQPLLKMWWSMRRLAAKLSALFVAELYPAERQEVGRTVRGLGLVDDV